MRTNIFNWLALLKTPEVGPVKFHHYLEADPNLDVLPAIAQKTIKNRERSINQNLRWAEQKDCHIILFNDINYPKLLKNIHAPPPVLFVKGDLKILDKPQIAIVGSRKASYTGIQTAFNFGANLAKNNIIVTSGLAKGIDSASHQGALSQGCTIAVIANGLDIVYPKSNINLVEQITRKGAIVSEFPLGVLPLPGHFPRRNRIISGLSLGVIVVEASINSGSLITAHHALEQGKEIFAVPGSIYSANAQGCHKLIKQGAQLVSKVEEVVEALGWSNAVVKSTNVAARARAENSKPCLDGLQNRILNSISYETTSVDLIVARCSLLPNIVNSVLVELELNGYITSVSGGYTRLLMGI